MNYYNEFDKDAANWLRNLIADERHLWPAWFWLIEQSRPNTIFGEQVASRAALAWLELVSDDLEAISYAIGSTGLPACGAGAPHGRNRLYFVADAGIQRQQKQYLLLQQGKPIKRSLEVAGRGHSAGFWGAGERQAGADGKARIVEPAIEPLAHGIPARVVRLRGYGNAIVPQVAAEFIGAYLDVASNP